MARGEAYVTFGDTPGLLRPDVNVLYYPRPGLAHFGISHGWSPGPTTPDMEMDITFDGESGNLSHRSGFTYKIPYDETQTRKKLVFKIKNATENSKSLGKGVSPCGHSF